MPELPEVEGFRRRLEPVIVGRTITGLDVFDEKRWHPSEGLRGASVIGGEVKAVQRAGKMLLFTMTNGLALALHLKIAGQLVLDLPSQARVVGGHPYPRPSMQFPESSTRFLITFDGDIRLWFNDQRRFGWLRLMPESEVDHFVGAQSYGPDPTANDFTPEVFGARLLARAGRPVKVALLDQTCVAGVGNIYADESLYRARINPRRLAGSLSALEVQDLHRELVNILAVAIPVGGALMRGNRKVPRDALVESTDLGRDFLEAHGCSGLPCPRCIARGDGDLNTAPLIVRTVVGGRGTYICPSCQPDPFEPVRGVDSLA